MFEVGDKVRYVGKNDPEPKIYLPIEAYAELEAYGELLVDNYYTNDEGIPYARVRTPDGQGRTYRANRFELSTPKEYKTGDVVHIYQKDVSWAGSGVMDYLLGIYDTISQIEVLGLGKNQRLFTILSGGYFVTKYAVRLVGREGVRVYKGDEMPKKEVKKVKEDIRDLLDEKVKNSIHGGICDFAFKPKDSAIVFHHRAPCHAALHAAIRKDIEELALNFHRLEHYIKREIPDANPIPMEERVDAARQWMKYIMNKSPWAIAFNTKLVHIALGKGILMNVDVSRHIIAGACVVLREATEYNDKALAFVEFKSWKLWDDDVCFLLSQAVNYRNDKNDFHAISFGGGHQVFGVHNAQKLFSFMANGYDVEELNKQPYRTHHGAYSIEANIASSFPPQYIQNWISDNLKAKVVGEGWAAVKTINKESIVGLGDKFKAALKEARKPAKKDKDD